MIHEKTKGIVYGVDISPEMIDKAKENTSKEINYLVADCS
jgi:ubiquinone/menaquinone biosynthesis C-methylase UbiE